MCRSPLVASLLLMSAVGAAASYKHRVQSSDDEQRVLLTALSRYERDASTGPLVFNSVRSMTSALTAVVPKWVAEVPEASRERRQRMAALFVLDLSWADFRGPTPFSRHRAEMLEWACKRLREQPPSEFGRLWMLTSYALLEPAGAGFGDVVPMQREQLQHARQQYPDDSRLKLAELLLRPAAINVSNRPGASQAKLVRTSGGRVSGASLGVPTWPLDQTLKDLSPLADDPTVGAEVQAHIGLIQFHQNRLTESLANLTAAARKATDPFVANLAGLMAGLAYESQGRPDEARSAYEGAVVAIPTAKTSALALAASWFLEGRREDASALLDRAFDKEPGTLDPWQHLGDMLRFVPAWMAELHAQVGHRPVVVVTAPPAFTATATEPGGLVDVGARYAEWKADQTGLPKFRSTVAAVLVDASVRNGNQPVENLAITDFELLDNGVPQQIDSVSVEALPIDLTLVVDYYDATGTEETNGPGQPWFMGEQRMRLRDDIPNIGRLLQHADRIRVVVVENEPREILGLQAPGAPIPLPDPRNAIGRLSYGRNSAIYDSVALALMRQTPMGRRHMVLAFSEGADDASVLTKERLLRVASQADAVMHLFKRPFMRSGYPKALWPPDPQALSQAATATGGSIGDSLGGSKYQDIQRLITRLRQSYLLRYQPTGVAATGWHSIQVRVVKPGRYNVQSRKGYWGG